MRTPTRIFLLLLLCFVTVIAVSGLSIYYFLDKYSYNDLYKRLETRARLSAIHHFDRDSVNAEQVMRTKEAYLEKLPDEREHIVACPPGTDLAAASVANDVPRKLLEDLRDTGHGTAKRGDTFYSGIRHGSGAGLHLVVVSAHNYYASHHLTYLRNLLWAVMGLTVLITAGFFLYFRSRIFDPIARITREVKQISTENMHLRLAEGRGDRDITALIGTFNGLLDRMETAFETQKNFISNASHEFGTPLTSIIGEADVTLAKERTPAEYEEALRNILHQADRLDKITRSLLFLAKTGYVNHRIGLQPVRMDEVVWKVKEMMDDLHPGHRIAVDFSLLPENPRKLKVNGSADLLHLAIANIVNNAFKYGKDRPVLVSVAAADREVVVIVRDEGIGIPENELAFIYDPFFRASNTTYFEGFGIGLPLTRNIIKLHGGRLNVMSRDGAGTTVQVNLPTLA